MDFDGFVLAASTSTLTEEPQAREHADAVEFRMDLADNPLTALRSYDGEMPVIATNRASWEGGEADDTGRLDALAEATMVPAVAAVDVELASLEAGDADTVLNQAGEHDVAVVASVHDFETTPAVDELHDLLVRATNHGDVGKLAVTAADRGDVLDLLTVTHELTANGHRVATMAMGEAGRHSRAVAPVYGSAIGYAPVDPARATAPGQYDLETLASLITSLTASRESED